MKTLPALAIITTLVCLTAGPASADLINGLDGYWTFNETNGGVLHDYSGHGFNGTLVNFPNGQGNWTTGLFGGALEFGGAGTHQYVRVPDFAMPTNSMTLTAWVWANSTPYWATIAANWNGAWGAFNYSTFGGTAKMSLYTADAYVQGGIEIAYGVSLLTLSVNHWHFVAFVANSQTGSITFMQDWMAAGGFGYHGRLLASSSQLNIGDDPSDTSPGQGDWDGKIEDLAIWTRALSPQELVSIYNAGLAGHSLLTLITPTLSCAGAQTAECGTPATVTAQVGEPDGAALMVVWALNGTIVQTNMIPAGPAPTMTNLTFTTDLPMGTNLVEIAAANSLTNTAYCSTTVTVVDTTPPVIQGASASPNILWPPNHRMVTVAVNAVATDNCGPATWRIISVQSNEPANGSGDGNTPSDWQILGDHSVALRAERSGTGSGRTYTITIQAEDVAGNPSAPSTVTVTVPKSMGK